jgi:nucleoside phosphorylase
MVMRADELRGQIHFGIITVKSEEFQAVHNAFDHWEDVEGGDHTYFITRVQTRAGHERTVSLVRLLEQGQDVAQKVTRDLIEDLNPKWIMLVGIAGGLPDNEYSLGDVLLASRIHDFAVSAARQDAPPQFNLKGGAVHTEVAKLLEAIHGFDANFSGWNTPVSIGMEKPNIEPPRRPDKRFYGEPEWKRKVLESLRRNFPSGTSPRPPKYYVAPSATSNTLVKDTSIVAQLTDAARAVSTVEMELGGAYLAAQNVPLLAIRGLSDIVGFKRDHDWTEYACKTAAALARALIISDVIRFKPPDSSMGPSVTNPARAMPAPASPRQDAGVQTNAHSLAAEFQYRTSQALGKVRLRITGLDRTFQRSEVSYIEDQMRLAKPVVLTGEAGTGKSGIGGLLAQSASQAGRCVLLLDARRVEHIKDEPGLRMYFSVDEPLSYAVARLGREYGFRLVIDQLDNVAGLPVAGVLIDLAIECSRAVGIEMVVISRKREGHERALIQRLTGEKFVEIESRPLNEDEAQRALEHLGVPVLSPELINLSRNLLNLEIIATIKDKQPDFAFANVYGELALWDGFIDALRQREAGPTFVVAEQTVADAMRLAQSALAQEEQTFILQIPLSQSLRRLESWDVIVNDEGQIYRFKHEKLQDYLYARYAADRGLMPSDVAGEIHSLRARNVLLWMDKIYAHRKSPRRVQFLREMLDVQ